MRVIVFGGAGFLGSHVVDELKSRGHEVTVFDLKTGENILDGLPCLVGIDIVYNFAGASDLSHSITHPHDTMELNIIGNLNVLEAAKRSGVKRYVYASTVYVFSKKGSYYGISKQAAERCVEESGVPYTILRYGTVYGPRADEKNRVYRLIRDAITKNQMDNVRGEREFIHVKDAARLSVDVIEDGNYANKAVMLTGNERTSYNSLSCMIAEILGWDWPGEAKNNYQVTPYSYRPDQSLKLMANPYIDLGQGLLETIEDISARLKSES